VDGSIQPVVAGWPVHVDLVLADRRVFVGPLRRTRCEARKGAGQCWH
jgi:hypothetical protein